MIDFITAVKNVLQEKAMSVDSLFLNNIISKDTFYKYKHRNPSLKTLIKVANYLEVSIDYLYELTDVNNFYKYSTNQHNFYNYLTTMIKNSNLSNRKFCNEMGYQKDIIGRYKNGVLPSVRTLFEIANYFNMPIDAFLTKED